MRGWWGIRRKCNQVRIAGMNRVWNKPYTIEVKTESSIEKKLMYVPLGMRLIGLKLYSPKPDDRQADLQIKGMQKSLYGNNNWFYFVKGFKINERNGEPVSVSVDSSAFDSSFLLYHGTRELKKNEEETSKPSRLASLNISAVVGQNGTGKSTLVDMIIRMINNLSVSVYGEDFVFSSAQHLHYIENVYASLAVYINDHIKILTVKGHNIYIESFKRNESERIEDSNDSQICYKRQGNKRQILTENSFHDLIVKGKPLNKRLLADWFYTIVCNYSLYAYNYSDYKYERTSDEKIASLCAKKHFRPKEEDYYWLKGIFHKNDGYQTPLEICPMRKDGYIDARNENLLGKQNLIMLAFRRVSYNGENGQPDYDGFPFRDINQTHTVVALQHYWKSQSEYRSFEESYLTKPDSIDSNEIKRHNSLVSASRYVRFFWCKQLGLCSRQKDSDNLYNNCDIISKQTWDYIVFKTYKVLRNYNEYNADYNFFTDTFEPKKVGSHLKSLLKDSTHRTRKLRQALAFIKLFDTHYANKHVLRVDVDDAYEWMQQHIGESLYVRAASKYHKLSIEDLLPPPCCGVDVWLVENTKLTEYKLNRYKYIDLVPFEGLSSGERQIAYIIGNLLNHAINIDSTVNDKSHNQSICYKHLNILMDEVELYFHPDLQRRFVKLLVDALNNSTWQNIRSMCITLVTHSPFVLSDIPGSNVLCISRDGAHEAFDKTFAANIHDLFNNTFILPNTIGELAKSLIEEFVEHYSIQINQWREQDSKREKRPTNTETENWFTKNKSRLEYLCTIVGDEYLANELIDMISELDDYYKES